MTTSTAFRLGAAMGATAVALGAFGAHGLRDLLASNGTQAIWDKAVFYHFVHALMLCFLANKPSRGPWYSFFAGIIVFSGTLYLLAVTNTRWLGAITPIGGICFIIGWVWLVICPATTLDGDRSGGGRVKSEL